MLNSVKHPRRVLAISALLLPLGTFATMSTASPSGEVLLCEIKATPVGSMIRMEAFAHADGHLGGTYSLQVENSGKSGRSTINQNGDFDAREGRPQLLSSVTLDAGGSTYTVMLDIVSGEKSVRCTKQIGRD